MRRSETDNIPGRVGTMIADVDCGAVNDDALALAVADAVADAVLLMVAEREADDEAVPLALGLGDIVGALRAYREVTSDAAALPTT